MKYKFEDIAKIKFGLHAETAREGNVKYLLAGHFNDLYQPEKFAESFVELNEKNHRFLLEENDLILAGKGMRTFAWAYEPTFGKCIPSSLFYHIRPCSPEISNKFLACLLNSEKMQYRLKALGTGATITSISKKELAELKIHIPDWNKQREIVDASEVFDKYILTLKKLLNENQKLKRGVINKLISKIEE